MQVLVGHRSVVSTQLYVATDYLKTTKSPYDSVPTGKPQTRSARPPAAGRRSNPSAKGRQAHEGEAEPDTAAPRPGRQHQGLSRPPSQQGLEEEGKDTLEQTLSRGLSRGPRQARGPLEAGGR